MHPRVVAVAKKKGLQLNSEEKKRLLSPHVEVTALEVVVMQKCLKVCIH